MKTLMLTTALLALSTFTASAGVIRVVTFPAVHPIRTGHAIKRAFRSKPALPLRILVHLVF